MSNNIFGILHKKLRIEKELSLRQYCVHSGLDAGNISKIERGLMPPPQSGDTLSKMAKTLGLKPKSEEWDNFFQTAAIGAGRLPKEVTDDTKLLERLPILLRTMTGQKLNEKQLNDLIEILKNN
jgi:transcriptional regulator with XRE-family HTH domain